jgi:hypothetical protein
MWGKVLIFQEEDYESKLQILSQDKVERFRQFMVH